MVVLPALSCVLWPLCYACALELDRYWGTVCFLRWVSASLAILHSWICYLNTSDYGFSCFVHFARCLRVKNHCPRCPEAIQMIRLLVLETCCLVQLTQCFSWQQVKRTVAVDVVPAIPRARQLLHKVAQQAREAAPVLCLSISDCLVWSLPRQLFPASEREKLQSEWKSQVKQPGRKNVFAFVTARKPRSQVLKKKWSWQKWVWVSVNWHSIQVVMQIIFTVSL